MLSDECGLGRRPGQLVPCIALPVPCVSMRAQLPASPTGNPRLFAVLPLPRREVPLPKNALTENMVADSPVAHAVLRMAERS